MKSTSSLRVSTVMKKFNRAEIGIFELQINESPRWAFCSFRCAQAQYCTEKVCASLSRLI